MGKDLKEKGKPFQLWTHYQDESPQFFAGYDSYEEAVREGAARSLEPIIYGTVLLKDNNGFLYGSFNDGVFQRCEHIPTVFIDPRRDKWVIESVEEPWDDPRPSWDVYFMSEAFRVSRRSLDKHTKHGCVLVRNKRIIATGFNSPPPGFIDSEADLERPGKYLIMSHAEVSAICNAALEGFATKDSIAFISGFPCSDCYRALWSAGIKEIIYAPIPLGSKYSCEHISYLQAARNGPKLTPFSKNKMKEVIKMLDDEYDYIVERIDFNTPDQLGDS